MVGGSPEQGGFEVFTALARSSLTGLAILALTLGNSGAALAGGPPTIKIEPKAALDGFGAVTVVVDANCGAGATAFDFINVQVSQSSATGEMTGFGGRSFTSDGTRQQVAVTVVGFGPGWNVGDAVATAQLFCGILADQDLGAKIRIGP
jgi:hypothetical protein